MGDSTCHQLGAQFHRPEQVVDEFSSPLRPHQIGMTLICSVGGETTAGIVGIEHVLAALLILDVADTEDFV